jgi:hypothetical protein
MYDLKFYQACMGGKHNKFSCGCMGGGGGEVRGTFVFQFVFWCGEWAVHFPLGKSTFHPSFIFLLFFWDGESKQRVPKFLTCSSKSSQ